MSNQITVQAWDKHYTREKSKLGYPDENLVRILSKIQEKGKALDFGAGSGRHCNLLQEYGYQVVAADYSSSSVQLLKETLQNVEIQQVSIPPYPFPDKEFTIVVNWGVLHYNTLEEAKKILKEFQRITITNGYIAGSIRADRDTHLKLKEGESNLPDLQGAKVKLYSLEEVKELLSIFSSYHIGYMERTPLGKMEERICHWIYLAKN